MNKRKTAIILLVLLFFTFNFDILFSQNMFYDLSFEQADSTGKSNILWQYEYLTTGTKFIIDKEIACSGMNSFYIKNIRQDEQASLYFKIPEKYYKDLRSMIISVNVRDIHSEVSGGNLWFKVMKGKKNINQNKYKGYFSSSTPAATLPNSWTTISYEITTKEDPDSVIIGLRVLKNFAWFDDISIVINGEKINDLVFLSSD